MLCSDIDFLTTHFIIRKEVEDLKENNSQELDKIDERFGLLLIKLMFLNEYKIPTVN